MDSIDKKGSFGVLENLGNIGDFVGGVGVVITLFYLAFQIRASRLQTLAEDTTDAVRGWLDAQTDWLQTGESVNLIRRAFHNYENLTPDEKGRFAGYQIETAMAAYLRCPGVQDWWTEAKPFWPEHVAQRMDQIVAGYSGPPMSDALSFYARME